MGDAYPGQLLHQASLYNNAELLTTLLEGEERQHVNGRDAYGRTPVYTAVSNNAVDCLRLLLQNGADPNLPAGAQCHNMTPLIHAVCDDKEEVVRLLLQHGADLGATDNSGKSALAHAKYQANHHLARLLEAEQDIRSTRTQELANRLAAACQAGEVEGTRALLQEAGHLLAGVLATPPSEGLPPLCIVCSKGSAELFQLLVDRGCQLLAHSDTGVTALHLACRLGHTPLVSACLERFPELVRATTSENQLPVHMAAGEGKYDAVVALLSHDYPDSALVTLTPPHFPSPYRAPFDLNARDAAGMTPLHLAAQRGFHDVVCRLLDHCLPTLSAEDKSQNGSGDAEPPSMDFNSMVESERPGDRRIVDVAAVNTEGLTAVHEALRNRHLEVVEVLLDAEPSLRQVRTVTQPRLGLLEFALEHGDLASLELLLRQGTEDPDNATFRKAVLKGNDRVKFLLLKHKSASDQTHTVTLDKRITSAVSITWGGLNCLNALHRDLLVGASLLHNPALQSPTYRDSDRLLLEAITKVDISGNRFETFPLELLKLPSLHDLNASNNQIEVFPEMEGEDREGLADSVLEELNLSHNRIRRLPDYLFLLPDLATLIASSNSLQDVPCDIWSAKSLAIVDFSHNQLSQLPDIDVKTLSLIHDPRGVYVSFPTPSTPDSSFESIDSSSMFAADERRDGNLPVENDVKHLHYWETRVRLDDSGLRQNEAGGGGIRILNLAHNKFEEMPGGLACSCPALKVLNLSANDIKSVCPVSAIPAGLKELHLAHNRIASMAPWAAVPVNGPQSCTAAFSSTPPRRRSSPTSVSRSDLQTTCCHRQHSHVTDLAKLSLANNLLKELVLCRPPSDSASDTRSMVSTVSMDREEIQGRLVFPHLEELDLSFNALTCLPPEIGDQSDLRALILKGNKHLNKLPPKLGLLKQLWKLELEGCPLPGTIQDLMRTARFPVKDILGFLLSVHEDSTEYNCMNLMIVGVHKIGKTSLLQKLLEMCVPKNKRTTWNERVGQGGASNSKDLLSTVGIDINMLPMDRRSYGKLQLRTWDFGGQREYYATHQYFLSPRSLYLVVWNITHGEQGIHRLQEWLINIQARAPQSHVIIVGTHLDLLTDSKTKHSYPENYAESMNQMIEKTFIMKREPSRSGLPIIHDPINISCKTGENVKQLMDKIYYTAFEHVKHPRSPSQPLLSQKVPKKYLQLQKVVQDLAQERLQQKKDPVLVTEQYKLSVLQKLMDTYQQTFRDAEELEQATRFLHDNGVLFHYDDALLCDLYFLDPQWLCDQLAKVITIPEINRFATRGVMRIKDLEFLFRNSLFNPENLQAYITKLLSKFEVALQFDEDHLLLPSLLPTEAEMGCQLRMDDTKIPLLKPNEASVSVPTTRPRQPPPYLNGVDSGANKRRQMTLLDVKPTHNVVFFCCRLYFMSYFPSGFWPRLITRILADSSMYGVARQLFQIPEKLQERSQVLSSFAGCEPEWRCWQTGIELLLSGIVLLRIREVSASSFLKVCDYTRCRLMCSVDSDWVFLDVDNRILELSFPTDSLQLLLTSPEQNLLNLSKTDTVTVYRQEAATAQLLVLVVQHIDTLLQDWYPDLGEHRFEQNCEGRYLLTRVVPCPQCLYEEVERQRATLREDEDAWFYVDRQGAQGMDLTFQEPAMPASDTPDGRPRKDGQIDNQSKNHESIIYCFLVERCMLNTYEGVNVCCPHHKSISPSHCLSKTGASYNFHIAPDVVFGDLGDFLITQTDRLEYSTKLGKGSFGHVYSGTLVKRNEGPAVPVAVKIFFQSRKDSRNMAPMFQDLHSRLEQASCAYVTARQEVSILRGLQHPRIVSLLGLALQPLCLLLSLAPCGSLEAALRERHARGQMLPLPVIRLVILQVSEAIAYLHSKQVIYRDLKSDNVLVWSLPTTPLSKGALHVDVRLADYGISRTALLSGQRGFGGTPPFIAPEILLHGGKDTYTEKVDIFSFGMFLYELLTCTAPLQEMANPSTFVCQGGRPAVSSLIVSMFPKSFLDLMTLCWSQLPDQRPSSPAIMAIAQCPLFCHLRDVVSLADQNVMCGCAVVIPPDLYNRGGAGLEVDVPGPQVWLSTHLSCGASLEILSFDRVNACIGSKTISLDEDPVTALAVINNYVWCATNGGFIRIYSLEPPELCCSMEVLVDSRATILGLHPVTHSNVAIPTGEGVMVVLKQPFPPPTEPTRPYSCKIPPSVCSILVSGSPHGLEIWLGLEAGAMCIMNVDELREFDTITPPEARPRSHCTSMVFHCPDASSQPCVFSYVYPGSVIYMWNVRTRMLVHSLDIAMVVPKTSVTLSAGRTGRKCQVTAMNAAGAYFYAGTTNGSVVVASSHSLEPISMFKAHMDSEFYVKCILPLQHPPGSGGIPGLVTVGRGYSDFIQEAMKLGSRVAPPTEPDLDGPMGPRRQAARDPLAHQTFLLSWTAEDWELY